VNDMDHFYNNIEGFFDFEDVYKTMVDGLPENSHFVEIGAFYGKSTAFMATEIANCNKKIKFDVVDTWRGSPEHQDGAWDHRVDFVNDTAFEKFTSNLKPVEEYYTPIKMSSTDAAMTYADKSLNFVFIDSAHDYESVKTDILAWLPKIKPGRYIGGHDYTPGTDPKWNNGVDKAVKEIFGDDFVVSMVSWIAEVK